MDLFTKDNITFVLALIGSVGTVLGWIYTFITSQRKIDIEIYDYTSYIGKIAQFFIHFQNQSFLPICIMSVTLVYNGVETCCELIPKKIRGSENDLIKSPMFPINLVAKQGCLYFLEFVNCEQISLTPGSKVDFSINTNRGKIHKSVILSDISHYLHIN